MPYSQTSVIPDTEGVPSGLARPVTLPHGDPESAPSRCRCRIGARHDVRVRSRCRVDARHDVRVRSRCRVGAQHDAHLVIPDLIRLPATENQLRQAGNPLRQDADAGSVPGMT